jgi:DNA-binding response OmpR family regulator
MAAPLFILSFRQRDELSRIAAAAGWQAIAARRADEAEARYVASGASVALVDARGAAEEAEEAVRLLGEAVDVGAGALVVLLSRNDEGRLGALLDLGATHFLVSPFSDVQLQHALRYAARMAARTGGRPAPLPIPRQTSWHWQPGGRHVGLDATLGRKLGLSAGAGRPPVRAAMRAA